MIIPVICDHCGHTADRLALEGTPLLAVLSFPCGTCGSEEMVPITPMQGWG